MSVQTVSRIQTYPLRYDPTTNDLRCVKRMRLKIRPSNPTGQHYPPAGPMGAVFEANILGYQGTPSRGTYASDEGTVTWPGQTPTYCDYLMIIADGYYNQSSGITCEQVQDLAFHRADFNGYDVVVRTISQIGDYTLASSILTGIQDFWTDIPSRHFPNGELNFILLIGDEVAVFTSAGLCVGCEVFQGEFPLFLAAWMDDYTTEEIDGYIYGEPMSFKLWDASQGIEIFIDEGCTISAVEEEDPKFPTHSGFGIGFAAIRTLGASDPYASIPQNYALGQNYPNPFNPTTTIPFAVPTESKVKIEIYNLLGERVAILENSIFQAGIHKAIWDGCSISGVPVASGVYLLQICAKGTVVNSQFIDVGKLLLIK